jgi:uncharacterized protein YmfQ (DUF2313 family)
MALPAGSAAQYAQQFIAALPEGEVWNKSLESNMYNAILALMGIVADWHERQNNIIPSVFPSTTTLIDQWNATLGLPNSCSIETPTNAQALAQITARFAGVIGQTPQDLINYAATFGFTITITESAIYDTELSTEMPIDTTANWIGINLPNETIQYFTAGSGVAGQALETVQDNSILQCELQQVIPATSQLYFIIG